MTHVTTKSSRTLDRQEVNEIALKSPSSIGDCIFGIGVRIFADCWYNTRLECCIEDSSDRFSQFICELFKNATRYIVWAVSLRRFDGKQLVPNFMGLHS